MWPELVRFAYYVQSIPAMSTECERCFSLGSKTMGGGGRSTASLSRRVSVRGSGFDVNSSRQAQLSPGHTRSSVNTRDLTGGFLTVTVEVYTVTGRLGHARSRSCRYWIRILHRASVLCCP
jgi:hypothetical protein